MSEDTLLRLQLARARRAHDATLNWLAGVCLALVLTWIGVALWFFLRR